MKEAHLLTAEYFTIHPTRTRSGVFSITSSEAEQRSQSMGGLGTRIEDVEPVEEIRDIPTLMRRLRRAAIDREKILAVCGFLEHGGEELYYLAEQVWLYISASWWRGMNLPNSRCPPSCLCSSSRPPAASCSAS